MVMNSPEDTRVVLRSVTYTQSLYLAACLAIALFFRFFFRPQWMIYVLWGAWFLAIYGIYEWLYFLIFQQPGDFIANRTYGESMHHEEVGPRSFQSWDLLALLRIKSTFGELLPFSPRRSFPIYFLRYKTGGNGCRRAYSSASVFSASTLVLYRAALRLDSCLLSLPAKK